jgi:hypothetical protein
VPTAAPRRLGRALAMFKLLWYEERVVREDRQGDVERRCQLTMPIAGRECGTASIRGNIDSGGLRPTLLSLFAPLASIRPDPSPEDDDANQQEK